MAAGGAVRHEACLGWASRSMGSGVFVQQGTHERRDVPDQPAVENVADRDATVTALVRRADDHPAMIVPHGETLTFERLHTSVAQLGRELRTAGVAAGDTVALSLGNGPDMVACFLAILAMRASAAPLNPAYTASEARAYVDDLRPRALIIQPSVGLGAAEACAGLGDGRRGGRTSPGRRCRAAAAHERNNEPAEGRAASPGESRLLDARDHRLLSTWARGRQSLRHAPVPCPRPPGLDARGLGVRRDRARPSTVQRERVLGGHDRAWSHLVLGGSHHSPGPEPARRAGASAAARPALRPVMLSRAIGDPAGPRRGALSGAAASGVRDDRGRPPDVHESAPTRRAPARFGRMRDRCRDRAVRRGLAPVDGATGEVAIRGRSVVERYRDNPQANETSFRDGWFRTGESAASRPTAT